MEKKTNLLLAISFFASIALFSLATWAVTPPEISTEENRKMAVLPKLSRKNWSTFPQAFEAYFNDRFFSRTALVKTRNWIRFKCWQISAAPSILIGKDGWLYFLGETGTVLTSREESYSAQELKQWKDALVARNKYFESKGIKYLFVVAPDKQSIYPEFFPRRRPDPSRLDQLSTYLGKNPEIPFVSLKPALMESKTASEDLYFKTDSHWNDLGAFIADSYVSAKLSALLPGVQPLVASNFSFKDNPFNSGDCTKLMGLFGWIKETVPNLDASIAAPSATFEKSSGRSFASEVSSCARGDTKLPRAVIFHDSFGDGWKPYLSRHFSRAAYQLRQADLGLDLDLIEAEKPDIVIQEVVERHVVQLLPAAPRDWRHQFCGFIQADQGASDWLCVLPFTAEVNSNRLKEVFRPPHSRVNITTCREWTDSGIKVNFDEKQALYCRWYLTKSGDQGTLIKDNESSTNYEKLRSFVESSGKFLAVKTILLLDGSKCILWKLKE